MAVPKPRHGQICGKANRIFGNYAEDRDIGQVLGNDSGVITERRPRYGARGRSGFLQFRPRSQRAAARRLS